MSSPKFQNHTLHIVSQDFFLAKLEWHLPKGTMSRDSIFAKNSISSYCKGPVIISDIKKPEHIKHVKKFFMQKKISSGPHLFALCSYSTLCGEFSSYFDPSRKDVHNSRHIECSLLCSAMLLLLILRSLLILLSTMTTILVSTLLLCARSLVACFSRWTTEQCPTTPSAIGGYVWVL